MSWDPADSFREKLRRGQVCLGTVISFTDPTVTEALCPLLDFVWIDMEHSVLSLEAVQGHVMATKGSDTTALVRVPWNDPVLIKPVLDLGAAGVIVPMVRTAEDVQRAVAACLYPPEGIRGFGPRRPSNYGRLGGSEFCREANARILPIAQVEHIEAVANLDEILRVPGLASIALGPNDLAGSMGNIGQSRHPTVLRTLESVIARCRQAGVPVGISVGEDPEVLVDWVARGVNWLAMGGDCSLLIRAATQVAARVREQAVPPRQEAP
jgi:2-dehydro-3-deoxyglucarate aldolase/4-hydroxy-2-oxoheptanedioate aldolase